MTSGIDWGRVCCWCNLQSNPLGRGGDTVKKMCCIRMFFVLFFDWPESVVIFYTFGSFLVEDQSESIILEDWKI